MADGGKTHCHIKKKLKNMEKGKYSEEKEIVYTRGLHLCVSVVCDHLRKDNNRVRNTNLMRLDGEYRADIRILFFFTNISTFRA